MYWNEYVNKNVNIIEKIGILNPQKLVNKGTFWIQKLPQPFKGGYLVDWVGFNSL